jgi:hypothetical protein
MRSTHSSRGIFPEWGSRNNSPSRKCLTGCSHLGAYQRFLGAIVIASNIKDEFLKLMYDLDGVRVPNMKDPNITKSLTRPKLCLFLHIEAAIRYCWALLSIPRIRTYILWLS